MKQTQKKIQINLKTKTPKASVSKFKNVVKGMALTTKKPIQALKVKPSKISVNFKVKKRK
jgi:hypothetical protein